MYFEYTINEYAEEPIMLLNKHIGYDADLGYGISGDQFQRELFALDGGNYGEKKCVKVLINCEGGNIKEGMSIYNAILKTKCKVDTFNVGMAASSAGWVFQAGRTRHMSDYAFLMMHNPYTPGKNATEEDKAALNTFKNSCATMLSTRSGKTIDEVKEMMDKETWMNSEACLEAGFCDVIEVSSEFNKKRMAAATNTLSRLAVANQIIEKTFINKNTMAVNTGNAKITAMLKLNPEASEDAIELALNQLQNSAAQADIKVAGYRNQVTDLTNKIEAKEADHVNQVNILKSEHTNALNVAKEQLRITTEAKDKEISDLKTDMQNKLVEYKKLKEEKEQAEAATTLLNAQTMVNTFAKQGRIQNKPEVIEKWVNLAIKDHDGTKEMIEALPLNNKAVTIETKSTQASNGISAASIMGEIAVKNAK